MTKQKERVVPCEVFSRVVGYFRPVHNWNDGKKEEFKERVCFDEKISIESTRIKENAIEVEAVQ